MQKETSYGWICITFTGTINKDENVHRYAKKQRTDTTNQAKKIKSNYFTRSNRKKSNITITIVK